MIPSFLVGPLAGAGGMALATALFFGWLHWVHDPAIRNEMKLELATAVVAEKLRLEQAGSAALAEQATETANRESTRVITRDRIIRVPITDACAASVAMRHALDSLRRPTGGGPGAAHGAPQPPGVPAPTPAP